MVTRSQQQTFGPKEHVKGVGQHIIILFWKVYKAELFELYRKVSVFHIMKEHTPRVKREPCHRVPPRIGEPLTTWLSKMLKQWALGIITSEAHALDAGLRPRPWAQVS